MPSVTKAKTNKATSVVAELTQRNPKCVEDYVAVRRRLVEEENLRRELEAELIEYAHIQIMEGNSKGTVLNLYGELGDEVELALVSRKPTEKQLIAADPDLTQLQEQLDDDRETTREKNQLKINQLILAMEELSAEIEQLSYSEGGHALKEEMKTLLKKAMKTSGSVPSIRFKELKKR